MPTLEKSKYNGKDPPRVAPGDPRLCRGTNRGDGRIADMGGMLRECHRRQTTSTRRPDGRQGAVGQGSVEAALGNAWPPFEGLLG